MITYVNSKDAKLFELAAEALGEQSLDVEQYLNRLGDLKAISPKFVRLPLYEEGHEDEEIFEIDANARAIKVPASFAKNGVGVVSDELAETVWFKINRYFDIKDFGQAVPAGAGAEQSTVLNDGSLHILIQWEAPDGAKGASWAYAIDKDTDDDFIYFGWALTAEHLTKKAGNIKFAVRILQYNTEGVSYSFATQIAQVAIKPTLDFDITSGEFGIEEVADKIANRIMNGRIAFCPVFTENGDLPKYIANLTDDRAELAVEAEAPRGMEDGYDAMAYIWYKKGANDTDFAEVPKTEDNGQYTPALTVTESGQYYVVVFGMVQIDDNTAYTYDAVSGEASAEKEPFWYHTSVASTKSNVCEIPAPIALEISRDWAEKFVLGQEDPNELVIVLKSRQKILNDQTVGTIALKIEKTSSVSQSITEPEFSVVLNDVPYSLDADDVTIRINMDKLGYAAVESDAEFDENETYYTKEGDVYSVAEISEFAEEVTYYVAVPATPGYYRITVINKLNGNEEETVCGVICRVTNPPVIPTGFALRAVLSTGAVVTDPEYHPNISNGDSLEAIHTAMTAEETDGLVYEWYFMKGQAPDDDVPDEIVNGASGAAFKPVKEGNYYVKLINEFNGATIEAISNVIGFGA